MEYTSCLGGKMAMSKKQIIKLNYLEGFLLLQFLSFSAPPTLDNDINL